MSVDPYIEYLRYRLKHEECGHIRKYIRAKIRLVLWTTAKNTKPKTPVLQK
jgi:hypothetical protein